MSLEQVAQIAAALRADTAPLTPLERRARFEERFGGLPVADDVIVEEVRLHDTLTGRLVRAPGADPARVLLWLHGGAFFLGSSLSYRAFAARVSAAAGMAVLVPDYRLVPEHRFPAAHLDTLAALDWLAAHGFARIAIGGDSAGGNLAAGAVQARIAAGGRVPDALWLISPYLDLTHSGESVLARAARDPFIAAAGMTAIARAYLGEHDPRDPRASPLFGAVEGFPPTLIQVGSDELLFSDAERFADRLRAAGHAPVFQEWAGMIHVWPMFAHVLDEGVWAIAQGGAFLSAPHKRSGW